MNFFVTGGSRGIGEAIVLEAVKQGHDVSFTYREQRGRAEAVIEKARALNGGTRVRSYQLDVGQSKEVERVGDAVLDEFGQVDVVVCNAGINRDNLLVWMSDEEWDTVMRTNLTGSFYVIRQFLPAMLANHFGRIVLISSLAHSGASGQANYCASKAGLHGLCSCVAKEYGRRGITANVVIPGFFETDMTRETMSDSNRSYWNQYCPVGRLGELDEVSKLVVFLASGAAGFVNGQSIAATGGLDWAP
jgi:NAD(P)-dependent dehydrogenase (short-subunit alcohol dehydrogenase family)